MAMWICWTDPYTRQERRLYNFYGPDEKEGMWALRVARKALSRKLGVGIDQIPGFRVREAPWLSEAARRVYDDTATSPLEPQASDERELVSSPM